MMPISRSRLLAPLAVAALTLGASGCGGGSSSSSSSPTPAAHAKPATAEVNPAGDIPDNQAYVAYSPPGSGYSVKIPEGWARTASGAAISFTDKLNRIQLEQQAAAVPLTPQQARRTLIPHLASTIAGFRPGTVSTVTRSAGSAVRVTYLARSPADPVTGKSHTDAVERYSFFHRGRSVVLTLSGPQGADNVDPWKIVTDSLRYTS